MANSSTKHEGCGTQMSTSKTGPLKGITVVDLTRVLAGPFCTLMLAELGARVIKVEEPGLGDDSRQYPPLIQGQSGYFASLNRDKESVALDLKRAEDRHIFEQLLEHADVLTENFRPGVMEKLGYGWETLQSRYPKLVYASISGYGHTGPSSQQPGYDMAMQAVSGMMSITGDPDGPPCRAGISIADSTTGMFAAIAVNAALVHRERTGETTKIDMAMFDCMLTLLETPINQYLMGGTVTHRMGSAHPSLMPFEAFPTADGNITISCGSDKTYRVLCDALGCPELAVDERYATVVSRVTHRPALFEKLAAILRTQSSAHWLAHFSRFGVAASPINSIAQALEHPQVQARNMVVDAHSQVLGNARVLGSPFKMSAFPDVPTRRLGPALDQDRAQVFAEFEVREDSSNPPKMNN
jgi:CoA:oxalate CoA-transferase